MEIEIFTLADFAQDNQSKLTVVGTFDAIQAKQFPAVHAACSIASRFRFSEKEAGNHSFRLRLIDEAGVEMIKPIDGNINIINTQNRPVISVNIVINFNQLRFEKPGRYSFELYMDDDWKTGLPLYLNQVPA